MPRIQRPRLDPKKMLFSKPLRKGDVHPGVAVLKLVVKMALCSVGKTAEANRIKVIDNGYNETLVEAVICLQDYLGVLMDQPGDWGTATSLAFCKRFGVDLETLLKEYFVLERESEPFDWSHPDLHHSSAMASERVAVRQPN
jgi:hypothetical protein